jgi:hypothetical protein
MSQLEGPEMSSSSIVPRKGISRTLVVSWVVSIVIGAFAVENIWIDPRITRRFHRLPSLVPEPGSNSWLLAFGVMGVACVLLIVGQILLLRRAGVSRRAKALTAVAAVIALVLSAGWFRTTNGYSLVPQLALVEKAHAATLTWVASTTPGVGYIVYRRKLGSGNGYAPLFQAPIYKLTYVDASVSSGESYEYTVKAVDAQGHTSDFSAAASASVP